MWILCVAQTTSRRTRRDTKLTALVKQFWLESGNVYRYRKLHSDLQDIGEKYGINRVHKLMKQEGIKAQVGYRKPRNRDGNEHVVVRNRLQHEFNQDAPDNAWVTDINCIKNARRLALSRVSSGLVLKKNCRLVNAVIND